MVRWSLKSRVVATTVAVVAVLMVLLILVARHYSLIGLRELLQAQQDNQVELMARQLDDKLEMRASNLQTLAAHLAPAVEHDPARLGSLVRDSIAIPQAFDWILLVSPDGSRIFDTRANIAPNPTYADRAYFRQILSGAPFAISDPVTSRATGKPVVVISVPVRDAGGKLVGVLNGGLDLSSMNFLSALARAHVGQTGRFCLVTLNDPSEYVMHADGSNILKPAEGARESCGYDTPERIAILGPSAWPVIARHKLWTTGWELVAALPAREAYSPITNARPKIMIVALLALFGAAVGMYLITRHLLIPLQTLHQVVQQSASDPSAYRALENEPGSEVGDLAAAFSSLMQQLTQKTDSLREAGKLAEERKQMIEAIANRIPDLVAYLDLNERYVFANRSYETRFNMPASQLVGHTVREIWGDQIYDRYVAPNMYLARAGEPVTFDYIWEGPMGPRCFEVAYKPVRSADDMVVGIHVFSRDVTEEREELQRLEQTTLSDHLTALLNRKGFDRRIASAMECANESMAPMALMLVDLDDFKEVNDTFGHATGDQLLMLVAGRLELCVRDSDAVARIGGDEFAIILEGDAIHGTVSMVANRIVETVSAPYEIDGREIRCGASVGCAIHDPIQGSSKNELFMRADTALYAAKNAGKGHYVIFGATESKVG